jgi:hypothetical protein
MEDIRWRDAQVDYTTRFDGQPAGQTVRQFFGIWTVT